LLKANGGNVLALTRSQQLDRTEKKGNDVEFLQLRYTDIRGKFRARYLSLKNKQGIEHVLKKGISFDGSSVSGFADIEESDLVLVPDRSTLRIIPLSGRQVATTIADVYAGLERKALSRDPRQASRQMERYLCNISLSCHIGPEVECFIFDNIIFRESSDENANPEIISEEQYGAGKYPVSKKSGYDIPPFQDSLLEFRFSVADILKKYYGIDVTNVNHEVASKGQIEINFTHDGLTNSADHVQIFKDVMRNVAKASERVACFMPKPIFDGANQRNDDNGSGMHVNLSLWNTRRRNGRGDKLANNVFYDKDDNYAGLSQVGRYFIGGLLDHSRSLAAIVAPTVNSYKRLVPGFEAPVYLTWARGNRTVIVRVPVAEKNNSDSKRIEFRAPDPSANPYLAFSAILAAGLDGIKKKRDPGEPVNEDIFKMSNHRKSSLGIKSLPRSLEESLEELQSDSQYLRICFNSELLETYIMLKREEIKESKAERESRTWQFMRYYDV
jgi:glutamine synthetase